MVQKFNPEKVMLSDSLGTVVSSADFTRQFVDELVQTSKLVQLGERVEMGNQKIVRKKAIDGELSDAYFVGEGEKIGVANVETKDYVLESKKIAVILPVTEEFLTYTWSDYFNAVRPLIVDKFNKLIDGAVFLGLSGNPFGANVLEAATTAGNVIEDPLNLGTLLAAEATPKNDPTAFVGHRSLNVGLRTIYDENTKAYAYDRATNLLDGIPYHELKLANGEEYPKNNLFVGDFKGIKYGLPNTASLRLKVSGDATLSKAQNAGPDSGDVHLFEQDMQALRAVFEIAVAIPTNESFAVVKAPQVETV